MAAQVLIVIGSDSDFPFMKPATEVLERFGVEFRVEVASAHRSPQRTRRLVAEAQNQGAKVIIAAAGGAAHLPGVIAAETTLPVIGVPIDSSPLQGLDALLAIVQMPPGIPVATVSVGKWGGENAAILAVQILALGDGRLAARLAEYKVELAEGVEEKSERLNDKMKK